MFLVFAIYFRLRFVNPEVKLPQHYKDYPDELEEIGYDVLSQLSFLSSIIVISALIKVFFFF